jgi:hypothetical protein
LPEDISGLRKGECHMNKFTFKYPQQFLSADLGGAGGGTPDPSTNGTSIELAKLTNDEVLELFSTNPFAISERDRAVQKAVETATKNKEKDFEQTLQSKRDEWEEEARIREAGVDLSENDEMKALQKEIYELKRTNLVKDAETILAVKNLPTYFKNIVAKDNKEATNQAIEELEQVMSEYIGGIKKDALRGTTPRVTTETKPVVSTKNVDLTKLDINLIRKQYSK